MSLNEQIKKFEEVTLPELESQLESSSTESLSKYLFVVGSGGNDYTLNYFFNKSPANLSVQAFTANLTSTLSTQLKVKFIKLHVSLLTYTFVCVICTFDYIVKVSVPRN